MTVDWKKVLILNLPYLLFVYLFDKLCQAVRLAPGLDASEKFLHLSQGFTEAFSYAVPSLHPLDLLVGIAGRSSSGWRYTPKGKTPANTVRASSTAAPDGARRRILPPTAMLAVVLCMTAFSVTAFAGGGDGDYGIYHQTQKELFYRLQLHGRER